MILQNNFEFPLFRSLGDLDITLNYGNTSFVNRINYKFSEAVKNIPNLYINDINYMSSRIGLENWINFKFWRAYKYFIDFKFMPIYCNKISSKIGSIYGLSKKSIVTDLDNVMWGGVIGDDGPDKISIGEDTSEGEGFSYYQKYLKELYERGITLNISSKNDEKVALEGISNKSNTLKIEDFNYAKINWLPKSQNIREISEKLNISLNSIVYVDDSKFEQDEVRNILPQIEIPSINEDPINNINIIDQSFFFENHAILNEDINRKDFYKSKLKFDETKTKFKNYDDFLKSLDMKMQIIKLNDDNLKRSTQLNNKTNQFNLVTKRLTEVEMKSFIENDKKFAYCIKLNDKFGDSGIISLILLSISENIVNIDNWLMSCRVFKRGLESAFMNYLVKHLISESYEHLYATYIPSKKNKFVENLFDGLGFQKLSNDKNGTKKYHLVLNNYNDQDHEIEVKFEG